MTPPARQPRPARARGPTPAGAWRRARGPARRAPSGSSTVRLVDALGGDAVRSTQAERLEALILRHCSRQIAAAVGPDASVIDVAREESPSTALLRAALDPSPNDDGRAGRRLFVLPPGRMNRVRPVDVLQLLGELAERCGTDDLLVAGAALPSSGAIGRTFDASTGDLVGPAPSYLYSVGRFESLAAHAGWRHCQLWSDGQGRYAIHVLERSGPSGSPTC